MKYRWVVIGFWGIAISTMGISTVVSAGNELSKPHLPFSNPQDVEIVGLPAGAYKTPISTEEPFVSRNGNFLFFNTGQMENKKDLHYAEWINGKWKYQGPIGPNINTAKEVEGNPTMDENHNLFFIDSGIKAMARVGPFSPKDGRLSSVRVLEGIPARKVALFKQRLYGNMGVEISADGSHLFFSRATWKLKGLKLGAIIGSDILFMKRKNGKFVYNEKEAKTLLSHINTPDLEYAASISTDGLELFFTRLKAADLKRGQIRSRIMHSTRPSLSEAFGKPILIEAIGDSDFVEGPAISGDGKELYYHKREGQKFRLYKVTR